MGTVVQKLPAPIADSIPWLLLSAQARANAPGVLARVLWVRRSETKGGVAPDTGCNASHERTELRVPYVATYTFYTGSTQP